MVEGVGKVRARGREPFRRALSLPPALRAIPPEGGTRGPFGGEARHRPTREAASPAGTATTAPPEAPPGEGAGGTTATANSNGIGCLAPHPKMARRARRRRSELPTTDTLLAAMAAAAIIGLSTPAAASGIAATL